MTRRISFLAIAVMIVGSGAFGAVSDHVLKIEMSSSYNYDFPGVPLHYGFKAEIQVDATVVSGSLQVPDGSVYAMSYYSKGVEAYLIVEIDGSDPSVWDGFGAGTYTFTVNYASGPSDSTSVDYQLPGGDPIPYVTQEPQFVYPQHDAIDVPLHCAFQFDPASNPDHTIDIWIEPEDGSLEALSYNIMFLPHDTSSYGPVTLSPDTLYEGGYSINYYVNMINADGIPTEMDTDAETQIHFTTAEPDIHDITLTVTEYRFGGVPDDDPYEFSGGVTGDHIAAVTLTTPGGVVYDLEAWTTDQYNWGFSIDDLTLEELEADFPIGEYTLTFNGGADSVTLTHNPTAPTGFANITSPAHYSTDVPLNPTYTWYSCSGFGDALSMAVGEEEADGLISHVFRADIADTSWTPSESLNPGRLHWMEVSVLTGTTPYSQSTNGSDTFNYYDIFENCSGVYFITEGSVHATVDITPKTLNLQSNGVFTAFIELPEGYGEEDVDLDTVKCEGAPAVKAMMADDNRLIVKFNRKDLEEVSPGKAVDLTVTGELANGTVFEGSDTIRIIDNGKKK